MAAPPKRSPTKRAPPRKIKAKRVARGADTLILDEINKLALEEEAQQKALTATSTRLAGLRLALDALQGKPVTVRGKTRTSKRAATNGTIRGTTGNIFARMQEGHLTTQAIVDEMGLDHVTVRNAINHLRKSGKVASVDGERGTYRVL